MEIPRFNVLGVGVHALDLSRATKRIVNDAGPLRRGYVCVTGVHGIMESRDDPRFRQVLHDAYMVTPDGMPLVWLGPTGVGRVYGPDLMLEVCDHGRARDLSHFFYGGAPGVAEELSQKLQNRFPGLRVAGTFTPPFRALDESEFSDLQAQVARSKPDFIWVGLSTPKQELFMAELGAKLDAGLLLGVGAAFDFHSGRVKQAPRTIQRAGLEWLYRLTQEPRRLAKRYLRNNPRFLAHIILQSLRIRKYPLVDDAPSTEP